MDTGDVDYEHYLSNGVKNGVQGYQHNNCHITDIFRIVVRVGEVYIKVSHNQEWGEYKNSPLSLLNNETFALQFLLA
jgi:hypothetical protein